MTTPAPAPAIEPDIDFNDTDSGININSSNLSSTTSINSSILAYRRENGRTYHAYKDGKYVLPNDDQESDRLDLQHHLFYLTFQNNLFVAPIPKTLHRCLDIGTGTGIWAMDFADEHPECEVIGIDLSPIQPDFVPPNLVFEIDDIEEEWEYKRKFDFIHSRMMTGSIHDWPKLIKSIYNNLNPGGWVQLADILNYPASDDNTLPSDSSTIKWDKLMTEGFLKLGQPFDSSEHYKTQLLAAGFTDVVELTYKWPTNSWPKDKRMKEIGMWNLENITGGLSAMSMALFTRVLGWKTDELEVLLAGVRNEIRDRSIHAYWPIRVVYGRKPGGD